MALTMSEQTIFHQPKIFFNNESKHAACLPDCLYTLLHQQKKRGRVSFLRGFPKLKNSVSYC